MTGATSARNPFDLVVYLTQTVPYRNLTQGNVILVLVLCVRCGAFSHCFTRRSALSQGEGPSPKATEPTCPCNR